MENAKATALELNAHMETVVNNPAYHAVGTVGDTEILCGECQTHVQDIIPQVNALKLMVDSFVKVWTAKGWVTDEGEMMPVYGDGNEKIWNFFWKESYDFVKENNMFTQDYQDMCAEIKRDATTASNPAGYLAKPEWMLKFKQLKERNKQIFLDGVMSRTKERMATANEYMTENFFGPLMLIKALWASRSKELVAAKDENGTLFCPICGSYEVKPVGQAIPRGKMATADDGYDRIFGFNQDKQVKEVVYFFADSDTDTEMNIIENMEQQPWEEVEAYSQEKIDMYNATVEEDIARNKFYQLAPYMSIGQVCKKLGKLHSTIIADEISDYYMVKM